MNTQINIVDFIKKRENELKHWMKSLKSIGDKREGYNKVVDFVDNIDEYFININIEKDVYVEDVLYNCEKGYIPSDRSSLDSLSLNKGSLDDFYSIVYDAFILSFEENIQYTKCIDAFIILYLSSFLKYTKNLYSELQLVITQAINNIFTVYKQKKSSTHSKHVINISEDIYFNIWELYFFDLAGNSLNAEQKIIRILDRLIYISDFDLAFNYSKTLYDLLPHNSYDYALIINCHGARFEDPQRAEKQQNSTNLYELETDIISCERNIAVIEPNSFKIGEKEIKISKTMKSGIYFNCTNYQKKNYLTRNTLYDFITSMDEEIDVKPSIYIYKIEKDTLVLISNEEIIEIMKLLTCDIFENNFINGECLRNVINYIVSKYNLQKYYIIDTSCKCFIDIQSLYFYFRSASTH